MLLLFWLFVSTAAQCDSGTCSVCKNMSGCDWYGWDCYNKSDSAVTILGLTASATCDTCQAASCGECQAQSGCSWFKSDSPNSPGTCAPTGSSVNSFTQLNVCPSCDIHTTCDACSTANDTCSWYIRGSTGKCREAAPSFTYSKGLLGYCGSEPCSPQTTCFACQSQSAGSAPLCTWHSSKNPVFYGPRCGSANNSGLSAAFYTPETTCPVCSSAICSACKAEDNCKWVALTEGSRQRFRQCLASSAGTPANKSEIGICNCALHSCQQCQTNTSCSWFTGGMNDDSCDMTSDADIHPGQAAATTCPACAADRCFECNGLTGCGWYADMLLGIVIREGCFSSANYPSGRTLLNNSNPKCKGVPNTTAPSSAPTSSAPTPAAVTASSALVVASSVTVAVLVLLA